MKTKLSPAAQVQALTTPWADGFAPRLIDWQRQFGRHGLPWQASRDAYRIWLSEIMLQQTQVGTVLGYYERFLHAFPTVHALAQASSEQVMQLWAGLGYYSRARNLHACAKAVVERHGGHFPAQTEALQALPGIGPSTAAAVAAFAYGTRASLLDGNVKRVFSRLLAIELPPGSAADAVLWQWAQRLLPAPGASVDEMRAYNQGLMDLGATLCTKAKPACGRCPFAGDCAALQQGRVHALPLPKPRKAKPVEHFQLDWIEKDGCLWVEPRPAKGIWAGLWMVPMHAMAPPADGRVPDLVHELTHRSYRLHVKRIAWSGAAPPSTTGRWVACPIEDGQAVPAPLVKLSWQLPQ